MKLLMISGDRSMLREQRGAFWYTLEEFRNHWERIDVICPRRQDMRLQTLDMRSQAPSPCLAGLRQATTQVFENVFFHPNPKGLWSQPWWILRKGMELIGAHHHDVMTVHEYPPFYNGIGAKWLWKKCSIPYATEIHHVVGFPGAASFQEFLGRWLSFLYLRFDVRRAKAVRCVNGSVKQLLGQWGVPLEKIAVVPSFYLDRDLLGDAAHPGDEQYDIVFCARLVPNKGARELLEAFQHMPPYVTALIIGDGPERTMLEREAKRLNIENRVVFRGWLSGNRDVYRAIQSGRIFVLPSKSEGGPRVALEAMALGLPVVVTRVGVMPEVVEDGVNGMFTSGEPEDIAEKVQKLLHDPVQRSCISTEARKILDRFERKKLIAQYADFLQHVAWRQAPHQGLSTESPPIA